MKRNILNVLLAVFVGSLVVGGSQSVQAAWGPQLKTGENNKAVVEKNTIHKGSLYTTGRDVEIHGTVEGDVYCAGASVNITGTVEGSVLCAAEKVNVSGSIQQNARLAGATVSVGGKIAQNLSVAAQFAKVEKSAQIGGDINGAAQELTIDGPVAGGLNYLASKVVVNGLIAESSNISTQSLSFGEQGKFESDLYYSSGSKLTINKDSVGGNVEYNSANSATKESSQSVLMSIVMFVGTFIVTGMMLAAVLPRFMEKSSKVAKKSLGSVFLAGSAIVFITPLVGILLILSAFGSYLAIIIFLLWVAILMLSGVFFAYYLGSKFLQNQQNILVRMLGGLVVLAALWLIPVVQIIAALATVVIGSGILVRALTDGQFNSFSYSLAPPPSKPPMPQSLGQAANLETPAPIAKETKIATEKTKKTAKKKNKSE